MGTNVTEALPELTTLLSEDRAEALALYPEEERANWKTHSDVNGTTLLMKAVHSKAPACVRYLADSVGVDVNQANTTGETPLMRAAFDGSLGILEDLLKRGASLEAKNHHGATALHYAYAQEDVRLRETLLAAGAAPDVKDTLDRTPEDWAPYAARYSRARSLAHR